jgi:hypothetical protein
VSEARRTYRFGPLERHGFLGAVRAGQVALALLGAAVGLALLGSSPSPSQALGAVIVFALSLSAATVPLAGRTLEQWAPVLALWLARRLSGAHHFRSSAPSVGARAGGGGPAPFSEHDTAVPAALSGVRIIELPYRDRSLGAVCVRGGRLLSGVLACRTVSFSLLDPAAQERALAHWGSVLASCADTPVRRIQWLERTAPARGDELAAWLQAQRDPRIAPRGVPIADSYLELIERNQAVARDHEILLAVQIDPSRVRSRARHAAGEVLIEETERIAEGLRHAGVRVRGALTAGHLAHLFRTAFDPWARAYLPERARSAQMSSAQEHEPWPLASCEGWDHYRSDGAVHCTFWICGWPRVEVGPLFLDALLSPASTVRTIAVTLEPLSAERSIREVEAQVTRDHADRALKARFGQVETARSQHAYDATRRREAELAAGYGEVRFTGFITVSAPDLRQLSGACAQVRRDAARSRIELRAMYGQQAQAFTFTLPLCRGLR